MNGPYGNLVFYAVYILNEDKVRIPARDKDRHNPRKQLHGAVKQALGVMQEGDRCTVTVYMRGELKLARLIFSEDTFTCVNERCRPDPRLFGDEDWLLPFLTPEVPRG